MRRAFSWLFLVCVNSTPVFHALGALVIAAMVSACAREYSHLDNNSSTTNLTTNNSICINLRADAKVKTLDIFIYLDTLNRPLEKHQRLKYQQNAPTLPWDGSSKEEFSEQVNISCSKGDKILIAIANSPYPFNIDALRYYDTAELLTMYYADEDPCFPLQSAVSFGNVEASTLNLKPLLCPVKVLSINNSTGKLLSHPSLRLNNINYSAQILRNDGFRPEGTITSPAQISHPEMMRQYLPYDLGSTFMFPNTTLYCYPNDSPTTLGTPPSEIILEAEQDGQIVRYKKDLPKIVRGGNTIISLNF